MKNYRDTIVKALPFMQFAIALYTLSQIASLDPKHPVYLCRQGHDTYGNSYQFVICEPQ